MRSDLLAPSPPAGQAGEGLPGPVNARSERRVMWWKGFSSVGPF